MKAEPHMFSINSMEELQFLRSQVQMLEREKAEMAAENQRLKDLLIKGEEQQLFVKWGYSWVLLRSTNNYHLQNTATVMQDIIHTPGKLWLSSLVASL